MMLGGVGWGGVGWVGWGEVGWGGGLILEGGGLILLCSTTGKWHSIWDPGPCTEGWRWGFG